MTMIQKSVFSGVAVQYSIETLNGKKRLKSVVGISRDSSFTPVIWKDLDIEFDSIPLYHLDRMYLDLGDWFERRLVPEDIQYHINCACFEDDVKPETLLLSICIDQLPDLFFPVSARLTAEEVDQLLA